MGFHARGPRFTLQYEGKAFSEHGGWVEEEPWGMRMKMDRARDSDAWLRLGVRGEGDDAGGWAESGLGVSRWRWWLPAVESAVEGEDRVRALRAGTGRKAAHLGGG